VIAVDATLPFDPSAWKEDQPVLRLLIAELFMVLSLLVPAIVDAARRGCVSVWMHFARNGVTRWQVDESPGEPSARFGPYGPSPNDEESFERDALG
jgi:hypothetical protein